jgi:hypothetical protein
MTDILELQGLEPTQLTQLEPDFASFISIACGVLGK